MKHKSHCGRSGIQRYWNLTLTWVQQSGYLAVCFWPFLFKNLWWVAQIYRCAAFRGCKQPSSLLQWPHFLKISTIILVEICNILFLFSVNKKWILIHFCFPQKRDHSKVHFKVKYYVFCSILQICSIRRQARQYKSKQTMFLHKHTLYWCTSHAIDTVPCISRETDFSFYFFRSDVEILHVYDWLWSWQLQRFNRSESQTVQFHISGQSCLGASVNGILSASSL